MSLPLRRSKADDFTSVCFLLFDSEFVSKTMLDLLRLQDLTDRDLAKQEREKTLNSLEAFIFETQVNKRTSLKSKIFYVQHVKQTILSPGQALPGRLPAGGVGGGEGADVHQAEGGVGVDGRGRLLGDHQAAEREAVSAEEPVQGHVLQGGGETQVAGAPGRPGEHAQHLQLLPQVSV